MRQLSFHLPRQLERNVLLLQCSSEDMVLNLNGKNYNELMKKSKPYKVALKVLI